MEDGKLRKYLRCFQARKLYENCMKQLIAGYPYYTYYRVVKGGGPRGGVSLIFPKVPQSSRPESLGFTSYPLPLDTPPLRTL